MSQSAGQPAGPSGRQEEQGEPANESSGFEAISWPAMLLWVALLFAAAAAVAYWLVAPFFHHR